MNRSPLNLQIVARHAERDRGRAAVEVEIVDALIARARAEHCRLVFVLDGDTFEAGTIRNPDAAADEFKAAVFAVDVSRIVVLAAADDGWNRAGSIWLVRGNGADLISDYTLGVDSFLEPVMALAETLG